jgi:hypothetical protein
LIRIVRLALAAIVVAGAGCRQPLQQARPSVETLAQDVLTSLENRDTDRLRALALDETEFREVIWPELPAARPERNLTADYVWGEQRIKSEAGLQGVLSEHGGHALRLVRVEFRGETTQQRTFLVRRNPVVVIRDASTGGEQTVKLFGSIVERDGGFKIFSYNVD